MTQYGPLLTLPLGPTREFSFGPAKAHAILKWLDAVKSFAAKHPAEGESMSSTDVAKLV